MCPFNYRHSLQPTYFPLFSFADFSHQDQDNLISSFFRPRLDKFPTGALKKLGRYGGNNDFNVDDGNFDDESVPIMELQYYGSWSSTAEQSTKVLSRKPVFCLTISLAI